MTRNSGRLRGTRGWRSYRAEQGRPPVNTEALSYIPPPTWTPWHIHAQTLQHVETYICSRRWTCRRFAALVSLGRISPVMRHSILLWNYGGPVTRNFYQRLKVRQKNSATGIFVALSILSAYVWILRGYRSLNSRKRIAQHIFCRVVFWTYIPTPWDTLSRECHFHPNLGDHRVLSYIWPLSLSCLDTNLLP